MAISINSLKAINEELASLVRSGLPLPAGLKQAASAATRTELKNSLEEIAGEIEAGSTLSEALGSRKGHFPPSYVAIIKAGELSGEMPSAIGIARKLVDDDLSLREGFKGILIYPVIILLIAALSGAFMLKYVYPVWESLYYEMGAELPVSVVLIVRIIQVFAAAALLVPIILVMSRAIPGVKQITDRLLLIVPFLGGGIRLLEATRFCNVLGMMLKAGVPVKEALDVAALAMENLSFSARCAKASGDMDNGSAPGQAIANAKIIPNEISEFINAAAKKNALTEGLIEMGELLSISAESKAVMLKEGSRAFAVIFAGVLSAILLIALYQPYVKLGVLANYLP